MDLYSKIAIAEIFSIVVLAIVIYGFEIDGVKKVVASLDDKDELSRIFSSIFFSRITLFVASLSITPIVYLVYGYEVLLLTCFWLFVPLSYVFQNTYFFLAAEKNHPIAALNIVSRFLAVALILLFVKTVEESFYAPVIIGACYLIGAITTFFFLLYSFQIKVKWVGLRECFLNLNDSFHVFLSNASVLLYRDINVIILSLVIRDASVISSYSLAEKFVKCFQAVFRPVSQYFFPKVVSSIRGSTKPDMFTFLKILKSVRIQILCFFAMLFLLFMFDFVVSYSDKYYAYINSYMFSTQLFFIMSFSILFGIPNFMLGSVGLNVLGYKRYFAGAVLATGLINLTVCYMLSTFFGAIGAAISFVLAEVVLMILVFMAYFRNVK